ncbi:MAG: hypothetical protein EBR67_11055 [Proteobacteria bacterium]|nr:hypothetical protein [Pseudomonadota bacterium]
MKKGNDPMPKLNLYRKVRELSADELQSETREYFKNDITYNTFPNLASSIEELKNIIKEAPLTILSSQELLGLENSDVGEVISANSQEAKDEVIRMVRDEYGKDTLRIENALLKGQSLPFPIVIKNFSTYYLLGGNTRLCVLASKNYTMPVKVIDYANKADRLDRIAYLVRRTY